MTTTLICGGRDLDPADPRWFAALDAVNAAHGPFTYVIQGYARGADQIALAWATARGIPHSGDRYAVTPEDWRTWGKFAGPRRNGLMLARGKPDLVVALPGDVGTADMLRRAREAGVEVVEVSPAMPASAGTLISGSWSNPYPREK